MIVRDSTVVMSADHQYFRRQQLTPLDTAPSGEQSSNQSAESAADTVNRSPAVVPGTTLNDPLAGGGLDSRLLLIKLIVEGFTGKRIAVASDKPVADTPKTPLETDQSVAVSANRLRLAQASKVSEAGKVEPAAFYLSLQEAQQLDISIHASLVLANGEMVTVELEQQMARRLRIERELSASEAARYIDPLVINLSGPLALAERRAEFDLNGDGQREQIPRFASDSAYLALDRNGDGRINNGSELFGALSGNGFAELAQFDTDGNGFIDSDDRAFDDLLLFRPGASKSLSGIDRAGIEAIYLGSTVSPFLLTSRQGETLGRVRQTGFYLGGEGAGTVQQIDLVV